MNWRDELNILTVWIDEEQREIVKAFIQSLLTQMAKDMIGEEKEPFDFEKMECPLGHCYDDCDCEEYNEFRQELIKIAKKYGVEI